MESLGLKLNQLPPSFHITALNSRLCERLEELKLWDVPERSFPRTELCTDSLTEILNVQYSRYQDNIHQIATS